MELQNIGASNSDDAFYRYKMPKMLTKIEGRGNGIKTNIVNMVEIAKALARPPSYTTKYFGTELGAQSKFDEKTGTSLVNGSHDTAKLAGLLEVFIKKYVQCYGCKNPETEVIITKNQMIQLKCAACGFVSDVDMKDKLTTFILKNPPEAKKGSKDKKALRRAEKERMKEGEAADEEAKKGKKDAKKKPSSKDATKVSTKKKAGSSDEDRSSPPRGHTEVKDQDQDEDDDVEWQTDTSLEAAKLRIQEQLNTVTADMVMLTTDEQESKSKAKASKACGSLKGTSPLPEINPAHENGVEGYTKVLQEVKAILKKGVATSNQLKSSLASVTGTPQEVMSALVEAVLGDLKTGFSKEVAKKKNYFAVVAEDDAAQMLLLHAIEQFFFNLAASGKEIALVLKVLYDVDILEEENIVKWFEAGLAGANKDSAVWKNCKPFIEWLQSAESESEEE